MPCARAYLAGDGPLRSLKRVNTDHAGQERRSDNAASPRLLAFLQSRDDTERPVHSGEKIGDRNSDSLNVVRTRAGQRHESGFPLGDLVVAGATAFRAVVAETADGQNDQSRIEFGQPLGRESESIENSGAEVLHENIGAADEIFEGRAPTVGFQIERDRLLVSGSWTENTSIPVVCSVVPTWAPQKGGPHPRVSSPP